MKFLRRVVSLVVGVALLVAPVIANAHWLVIINKTTHKTVEYMIDDVDEGAPFTVAGGKLEPGARTTLDLPTGKYIVRVNHKGDIQRFSLDLPIPGFTEDDRVALIIECPNCDKKCSEGK